MTTRWSGIPLPDAMRSLEITLGRANATVVLTGKHMKQDLFLCSRSEGCGR